MKTIIGITSLFFALTSFSQENPWEKKSTENPWNTTKNNVENTTQPSDTLSSQLIDTTSINQHLITNFKIDSVSTIDYQQKGFKEMNASKTFKAGLITCAILNVSGVTVPTVISLVPNSTIRDIDTQLRKENPSITEKQIKDYKRGMKNKRIIANIGGCLTGIAINTVLLVSATIIAISL